MRGDPQPAELLRNLRGSRDADNNNNNFATEIRKYDSLDEGEVAIQQEGFDQPRLSRLPDDQHRQVARSVRRRAARLSQSGLIGLIFAHLFSLDLMSGVFARQMAQGKVPLAVPQA